MVETWEVGEITGETVSERERQADKRQREEKEGMEERERKAYGQTDRQTAWGLK